MPRKRWVVAGAIGAVAGGGIAVAAVQEPVTQGVTAKFSAGYVGSSGVDFCGGADSITIVRHDTLTGTITASDPRLSGNVRFALRQVRDQSRGEGWTSGLMRITDPRTGVTRFTGQITGVSAFRGQPGASTQAVLTGQLRGGDRVVATLTWIDDFTTINGELGEDTPLAPFNDGIIVRQGAC